MYSGKMLAFQIDANFGFPGAVLAMLIVDLPNLNGDNSARTVVLGPATAPAWGGGSVRGLRLRGQGCVDFSWNSVGVVREAELSDRSSNQACE
jgi:alpha-L-fucosidase 2